MSGEYLLTTIIDPGKRGVEEAIRIALELTGEVEADETADMLFPDLVEFSDGKQKLCCTMVAGEKFKEKLDRKELPPCVTTRLDIRDGDDDRLGQRVRSEMGIRREIGKRKDKGVRLDRNGMRGARK